MARQSRTEGAARRQVALEQSLLRLMQRKSYQKISVSDLCADAAIPRRTFYHYYESKDDLLDSVLEEMLRKCNLEVLFEISTGTEAMKRGFYRFFEFWGTDRRKELDVLLQNDLGDRLILCAIHFAKSESFPYPRTASPKLMELGTILGATSFFTILFYWCRNGYQETAEQMAAYSTLLFSKPLNKDE